MQLQGLGTSWMLQPKRSSNDAAYDQMINEMTTLEQIKPMMCPVSKGNPMTCMNCDGFKSCGAGQRAVKIMDDATKPKYEKKWEDDPKNETPHNERGLLQTACESGNAWNWLMVNKGLSKDAAGEYLRKLIKKYPGIAADYGGSRRIMQRPRVVTITGVAADRPVEARVAQEAAFGPKVEQVQDGTKKEPEEAQERENQKPRQDSARERAHAMLARDNPLQWLIDNEGLTEKQARMKLYNARYRYPELEPRYKEIINQKKREVEPKEPDEDEKPARGRDRCQAALDSGDPLQFLINGGLDRTGAIQKITKWRNLYPDLMEGYEQPWKKGAAGGAAVRNKAIAFFEECMEQADPAAYYAEQRGISIGDADKYLKKCMRKYDRKDLADRLVKHAEKDEPMEDDEISLEDFLDKYAAEEPQVAVKAADMPEPASTSMTSLGGAIGAKERELMQEKEQLEERLKWVNEHLERIRQASELLRGLL